MVEEDFDMMNRDNFEFVMEGENICLWMKLFWEL